MERTGQRRPQVPMARSAPPAALSPRGGPGQPLGSTGQLWAQLPASLAPKFRARAGGVAVDMVREIRHSIDEYSRQLEGLFGRVVIEGVEQAIHQFIDRMADPNSPQDDRAELFRMLGK